MDANDIIKESHEGYLSEADRNDLLIRRICKGKFIRNFNEFRRRK